MKKPKRFSDDPDEESDLPLFHPTTPSGGQLSGEDKGPKDHDLDVPNENEKALKKEKV